MTRGRLRRLLALAGAGALIPGGVLATGLATGAAAAAAPAAQATSVAMSPCALKYAAGSLYAGAGAVYRISQRTGALSQLFKPWNQICGVTVDGAGNVLVANGTGVVALAAKTGTFYGKRMTAGHTYRLVSGFDGVSQVRDVQVDRYGNVVFTVGGYQISHTNDETDSRVFALAERSGTFYGKKMTKGHQYLIAGVRNGGPGGTGYGVARQAAAAPAAAAPAAAPAAAAPAAAAPAAAAAGAALVGVRASQVNLGWQIGTLRFDAAGNIVLADTAGWGGNYNIPSTVRVIPLRSGTCYGQRMSAGWVYRIAGAGGNWADGAVATKTALNYADAVAFDRNGNLLIANGGNYTAADPQFPGLLVLAGKTGTFYGRAMTAGHLYQLPKIPAANAVAVDNLGNVLFAGNLRVYLLAERNGTCYGKKAHTGTIYTLAGTGRMP